MPILTRFPVPPKGEIWIRPSAKTSASVRGPQSGSAQLQDGINRAIEAIGQSLSNVSNVQSNVGARLNAITTQGTRSSEVTRQLNSALSTRPDTDYASAITEPNQQLTGLQAAQAGYVKLQNPSPFNYIQS